MQLQPLLPLVDEFAARLFGELDYVQEGHNAERFQVRLLVWFSAGVLLDLLRCSGSPTTMSTAADLWLNLSSTHSSRACHVCKLLIKGLVQ